MTQALTKNNLKISCFSLNYLKTERFLHKGAKIPPAVRIHRENFCKKKNEARYLDPKTSRWMSADPAMYQGDYIPSAPIDDEAKKRNGNLPGQGGIYNYVNLHVYHYAGNNPVKYTDPDGNWIIYMRYNPNLNPSYFYGMTTASTLNQLTRSVGSFLPFGSVLPAMQNGVSNLDYLLREKNYSIRYDTAVGNGVNGLTLALDALSFTTIGASNIYRAISYGNTSTGIYNITKAWFKDNRIMGFLKAAGNGLFTDVLNDETAIKLGYAYAIGANIYKEKNLKDKGISERAWAFSIKSEVLNTENFYTGLYKDVMEGFYD